MDSSLTQRRASLEEKIPDIKKTLDMVEYLRGDDEGEEGEDIDDLTTDPEDSQQKPLRKATFELNDTLFAEAELDNTDTVYLWLGVRTIHHSLILNVKMSDSFFI